MYNLRVRPSIFRGQADCSLQFERHTVANPGEFSAETMGAARGLLFGLALSAGLWTVLTLNI